MKKLIKRIAFAPDKQQSPPRMLTLSQEEVGILKELITKRACFISLSHPDDYGDKRFDDEFDSLTKLLDKIVKWENEKVD